MPNRRDRELPSLTPDVDQVEAFKSKHTSKEKNPSAGVEVKPRSSGLTVFLLLVILTTVVGGGWWLDQKDRINLEFIAASEKRILELENQLSATGEEMGESAGAMRARLSTLTEKTEELWIQMDKLWSSAWRKNQEDIKSLNSLGKIHKDKLARMEKQTTATNTSVKALGQKQTDLEFNVGILAEQLEAARALNTELAELKNNMETLRSNSLSKDNQQIELVSNITDLKSVLTKLEQRIGVLEAKAGIPPK